ncbi:MAG: outer membrane beta-barrel protein [Candidatus Cloacimonas sp.]|nr:porin family protein [Candidatus Cloacimonadota bacterium]
MKRLPLIFALVLFFTTSLFAANAMNVRVGFLAPSGADTGVFPGLSYGVNVDNVVEVGFGFDYFYKNFQEKRYVEFDTSSAGNNIDHARVNSDITTYYIPVMGTIRVSLPMELDVVPYIGTGLGWGLLWEDIFIAEDLTPNNEHNKIDEVNFYNGINWTLQFGVKYALSQNASIYGETFYNGGKMKKNVRRDSSGITWSELNMSGAGLRIGVELRL